MQSGPKILEISRAPTTPLTGGEKSPGLQYPFYKAVYRGSIQVSRYPLVEVVGFAAIPHLEKLQHNLDEEKLQ